MSSINRTDFFEKARVNLFSGSLAQTQVDGMNAILDQWEALRLTDLRWLAYMLATAKHETNATMQPVREAYWLSEEWRKNNLRYYPFYGRGLVQLTWERNYWLMTGLLHDQFSSRFPDFDMVANPDLALDPKVSVAVMFEGMLEAESSIGDFTGRALEQFFSATREDWVNARTIINGLDRAVDVADMGRHFLACLQGRSVKPKPMLSYGSPYKNEVIQLQKVLRDRHYYEGDIDGDFGPKTRQAVIAFQRAVSLDPVDGVVGDDTRKALGLPTN